MFASVALGWDEIPAALGWDEILPALGGGEAPVAKRSEEIKNRGIRGNNLTIALGTRIAVER